MRIWSLAAAVTLALLNVSAALGEDKASILEGAQKFCAEKYGDRLLGVSLEGNAGFSCRFAAVTRTESFKLPTRQKEAKAQPAWDLDDDEEDAPDATGSVEPASTEPSTATTTPGLVKQAPQTKPRTIKKRTAKKRRYKRRRYRKRRYRGRKRDPFAALFRNARKASRRKYRRRHVRRSRSNIRRRRR